MTTLLNTTDANNRLFETLGSAALFSSNTATSSPLDIPLNAVALGSGTELATDSDQAVTSGQATTPLDIASLIGSASGDGGLSDALTTDGVLADHQLSSLPVIGPLETSDGLSAIDLTGNQSSPSIAGGLPIEVAGETGLLQPVINPVNDVIIDFHKAFVGVATEVGLTDISQSVVKFGESVGPGFIGVPDNGYGPSNLVTDVLNLPSSVLSGDISGLLSDLGTDLSQAVHYATNLKTSILNGPDPSNSIPELIHGIGNSLQSLPLVTLNGGNNGNGDLLGGIVGDLSHSSSGHLIDLDIGPQQSNGLVLDLLSAPSNDGHTGSVNAIDVGPSGPHLLDLGLLAGGSNSDGLAGNLLGGDIGLLGGVTGGGATTAPTALVTQVIDVVPAASGLDHGLLDLHSAHII